LLAIWFTMNHSTMLCTTLQPSSTPKCTLPICKSAQDVHGLNRAHTGLWHCTACAISAAACSCCAQHNHSQVPPAQVVKLVQAVVASLQLLTMRCKHPSASRNTSAPPKSSSSSVLAFIWCRRIALVFIRIEGMSMPSSAAKASD
jgi:hypothetical protein